MFPKDERDCEESAGWLLALHLDQTAWESAHPVLYRREDRKLLVTGIDAWPGTPILDIEGCAPQDDLRPDATVPDSLESLWATHDDERGRQRSTIVRSC